MLTSELSSQRIKSIQPVFLSTGRFFAPRNFVYNCVCESVNEIFWDNFSMVKLNVISRGRLAFTQSLILICPLHISFCINFFFCIKFYKSKNNDNMLIT